MTDCPGWGVRHDTECEHHLVCGCVKRDVAHNGHLTSCQETT